MKTCGKKDASYGKLGWVIHDSLSKYKEAYELCNHNRNLFNTRDNRSLIKGYYKGCVWIAKNLLGISEDTERSTVKKMSFDMIIKTKKIPKSFMHDEFEFKNYDYIYKKDE